MEPLSIYVHVPFCATRCGYCDFNTYTADELGGEVSRSTFHEVLMAEIRYARSVLGPRQVDTVFIGGGTPTLIGASGLSAVLREIGNSFGLAADAEVTTEANPDSVDAVMLEELRASGFTRISFGMQSSSPHVLSVLDRSHTPGAGPAAARSAVQAGFDHVNIDLIYGTPGESDDDLRQSIDDALAAGIDHLSAYALIIEDGTPLARRIASGALEQPDDDIAAHRYELVDDALAAAGMEWYEISNWTRPGGQCQHNLAYWGNADWWGIGPGAHSHIDGVRWWNAKHPATYAAAVTSGVPPRAGEEVLTSEQQRLEDLMLGIRTRAGLPVEGIEPMVLASLRDQGLIEGGSLDDGFVVLTRNGRLLANTVISALTD